MPSPSREAIESYEARIIAYELGREPRAAPRATPAHATPARASRRRASRPGRATRPRDPSRPRAHARRRQVTLRHRARRIVVLTSLILLFDLVVSFWGAMAGPSNVSFGVRAVEWLRNNGAAGVVSDVERVYYSLNAPATGGPPLKRLPRVGSGAQVRATSYAPEPIAPAISPALSGEGQWRGTGPLVRGAAPVLVTTFRPDPSYPQLVAGVAWIDHTRTRVALYPGRYEPPNDGSQRAQVPPELRSSLLATFNSGFKLEDSGGGFFSQGRSYAALKQGQATLVGYSDGALDVRTWTGGPDPGPGISFARQNLPLIVENGQLNPALANDSLWGATLGNAVRVWRSGLGVDAHGNLIYAAADIQTAESLARILQHAGAVRAMQLDINYEWTTFNFYGILGAGDPAKLLPDMSRPATRYLSPDDRDFFAVYTR
jgi:hypothetical protein